VAIIDVTDKTATREISRLTYPSLGFVHQNWFDESQSFVFVGDESDETTFRVRTSTIVLDVRDLDNPAFLYTHQANTNAIDHNLYVKGMDLYQANYKAGLRVLEFSDLETNTLSERAYFDTFPDDNETGFDGAWSVYPYFASGTIIVSDTDSGLFILTPDP
jgi:choice-of-anchor B domain-containing protein